MTETSTLALGILRSTGIYSDDALNRIVAGRKNNLGMGFVEAVLKFGGNKEADFLQKTGEVLGLDFMDMDKVQPRPDVLGKLPASAVYASSLSTSPSIPTPVKCPKHSLSSGSRFTVITTASSLPFVQLLLPPLTTLYTA